MYVGDKGKILAGFRGDSQEVGGKNRSLASEGTFE